jgi:hypothetical protein
MMMSSRFVFRGLFAAAVASSLSFGVQQATAEPAGAAAVRACVPEQCNDGCLAQGYLGGGVCTVAGDRERCLCLFYSNTP